MKKLLFITFIHITLISCGFGQAAIDLKTLIGTTKEVALKKLENWGIKVRPTEGSQTLSGYADGIQVALTDDKVSTIWIEFTRRRTGAFPYQVDSIIKPGVAIQSVFKRLGKPDETGSGFKIGNTKLSGWVKWNKERYQLHCEISKSKIVMVTIMEPGWVPGG